MEKGNHHLPHNTANAVEHHPLHPFLPEGARLLMLGSFPPPKEKWAMDFYYPNLQNDMWRIMGIVFFGDREHFLTESSGGRKIFSKSALEAFLSDRGIALSDTAETVVRHKGNASDKFLNIIRPRDISGLISEIPMCRTIVTTGELASSTLSRTTGSAPIAVGECQEFVFEERRLRHRRMPSSSRAYPLPLDKKAEIYERMFREEGLL